MKIAGSKVKWSAVKKTIRRESCFVIIVLNFNECGYETFIVSQGYLYYCLKYTQDNEILRKAYNHVIQRWMKKKVWHSPFFLLSYLFCHNTVVDISIFFIGTISVPSETSHSWHRIAQLAYSWGEIQWKLWSCKRQGVGAWGGGLLPPLLLLNVGVCCRTKKKKKTQMVRWLWKSKFRCVFMNFMLIGCVTRTVRHSWETQCCVCLCSRFTTEIMFVCLIKFCSVPGNVFVAVNFSVCGPTCRSHDSIVHRRIHVWRIENSHKRTKKLESKSPSLIKATMRYAVDSMYRNCENAAPYWVSYC